MCLLRYQLATCFFIAAYVLLSSSALAQAAPTAIGPGSSVRLGYGISGYHVEYGQRRLGGAQGWVDANPLWWVGLELEARRLRYSQDLGTHADTYLAGPRISLLPAPVEPYVKLLAGSGRFTFPYNYAFGNYLVVAAGGGVDFHIGNRLQLRIIDIEYQRWPKFTFGSMPSYGISAGLSYSIHRSSTWSVR